MKKVLFTDVRGTLIDVDDYWHREEDYRSLGRKLNVFLEEGNYIAFVSNVNDNGHSDVYSTLYHTFFYLNSEIKKENLSQVRYFTQGNHDEILLDDENICVIQKDGLEYYCADNGLVTTRISKKEEAIDIYLKTILPPYQIYGLGDSSNDALMLLKCIKLGGFASIIDLYDHYYEYSVDNIIRWKLQKEFPELDMDKEWPLEIEKIRLELYRLFWTGNLNLEEEFILQQKNFVFENLCTIFQDEIEKVSYFPSFSAYYQKVLKRG